jgi:predicted PurR-regulated permease PerM
MTDPAAAPPRNIRTAPGNGTNWFFLAGIAAAGWLVYLLAPILTPFVVGATLAYLSDPLADRLEKLRIGRTAAVCIVFLVLLLSIGLFLLLLLPALEAQLDRFIDNLPQLLRWIKLQVIPWLRSEFGVSVQITSLEDLTALVNRHWDSAGGTASYLLRSLSQSGVAVIGWMANAILIPVVTFYLLRDWDKLVSHVHQLLPRRYAGTASKLVTEADGVLSAFMRGQLTVMLALGIIYSTGLWLVGLDLAFLIGLLAGTISFIPYAGTLVGIGAATVAALVQTGDTSSLLSVLLVFGVGQLAEGMLLTPWLVGERVGLHPVAVIFSVLAGGQLFGFLGVLLALPAASVVMVLIRHAHELYKLSEFYSNTSGDSPRADSGNVSADTGTPPAAD